MDCDELAQLLPDLVDGTLAEERRAEEQSVKVEADRDVCIGAGMCVMSAEYVFDQDDEGLVVVVEADVPAAHRDAARRAVAGCPSGALRLVED